MNTTRPVCVAASGVRIADAAIRFDDSEDKAGTPSGEELPVTTIRRDGTTRLSAYSTVRFPSIYPGVDVLYYGRGGSVEFDFVVRPGAELRRLRLAFPGAKASVVEGGALRVTAGSDSFALRPPRVFQAGRELRAGYSVDRRGRAKILITGRDPRVETIIDPVIAWAAKPGFGGTVQSMAVDGDGNVFVMNTRPSFGSAAGARFGVDGALVYKLDASGSRILWATTIGGSILDFPSRIAVDAAGAVYIAGTTFSREFPTTQGALQTEFPAVPRFAQGGTTDAGFLAKISPDGQSLIYGTYIGGVNSTGIGVLAVDAQGNAFVAGVTSAPGLLVTAGAYMTVIPPDPEALFPRGAGFAARVNSAGSGFVYSTYLPFSPASGILDVDGNAYLAEGGQVIKLDAAGARSLFRVTVDAPDCRPGRLQLTSVALDSQRNVFLAGATTCARLAGSEGAFQPAHDPTPPRVGFSGDANDGYLIKIAADGTGPLFSTFFGGSKYDRITAIAVAPDDSIVIVGSTASQNLSVTPDALQPKYGGGDSSAFMSGDGFVARISSSGDRLLYSSYFGSASPDPLSAVIVDAAGTAYLGGSSFGPALITPGSARVNNDPGASDLVVKYGNDSRPAPVLDAASPASAETGSGELIISLSGSGFAENAQSLWNGDRRPTIFVSESQLMVTLSAADLALSGAARLQVLNPGSGLSKPAGFLIVPPAGANPTPRVTTIVPTSAVAGGERLQVSVRGSGFTSAVSALWNGSSRPTRFIGTEEIQFEVTADDLAQAGTAEVAVETPSPGGGRSNSSTFVVASVIPQNPPTLLSVIPSVVNAGSPATSFRISAYAVTPSTVLRFNGVEHPLYKHGDLDGPVVDIPREELVRAGIAYVTLYDPSTRRESNPLNIWIPLNLPSSSLVYSAFTKRAYIAAKDSAKGIVVLDPATGQVEGNFLLDAAASKVGVSSDGKLLYALISTVSGGTLRRYALRNGAPWLESMTPLPPQSVIDFQAIPGKPSSVAVVEKEVLTIFDDTVARPRRAQIEWNHGGLAFSDDGSTVYIFSDADYQPSLQSAPLSDEGVGVVRSEGRSSYRDNYRVTQFGGRFYAPSGRVYEANTLRLVGSVPMKTYVPPLVTPSAMVWLGGDQYDCLVAAFDPASFAPLWEIHAGSDCSYGFLSFSGPVDADGRILFLMNDRIFVLQPPPSAPGYAVVPQEDVVRRTVEIGTIDDGPNIVLVSAQDRLPFTAFSSEGGFLFSNRREKFTTGIAPARLRMQPDLGSDFGIGTHTGAIYLLLSGTSNPPVRVPFEFEVIDTYPLQASVSSLAFSFRPGDPAPAPQSFLLTKEGKPASATLRMVPYVSWLQLWTTGNGAPETITVTAVPGSLAPGTYTTTIQMGYYDSIQPLTIPVTLTIGN